MTVQGDAIPPFPRAGATSVGTGGEGCALLRPLTFSQVLTGFPKGGVPPFGQGGRGAAAPRLAQRETRIFDPKATGGSPHSDLPISSFMISFVPP